MIDVDGDGAYIEEHLETREDVDRLIAELQEARERFLTREQAEAAEAIQEGMSCLSRLVFLGPRRPMHMFADENVPGGVTYLISGDLASILRTPYPTTLVLEEEL